MIQRIQSIYLLLAGIFPAITFFVPVAIFVKAESWFKMASTGYELLNMNGMDGRFPWGLLTFAILSTILPLIAIFQFKKRKRQLYIATIAICSNIVWYIALAAYAYSLAQRTGITPSFTICSLLPLLAIVVLFLARRAIRHDEALVKAADRIR